MDDIPILPSVLNKTLEAMDILQRLAGACQENRGELPDEVIMALSEWESFSEG